MNIDKKIKIYAKRSDSDILSELDLLAFSVVFSYCRNQYRHQLLFSILQKYKTYENSTFLNTPKAFHWTIINTTAYLRHTLG